MVAVRNICIAVALGLATIASGATISVRKDGAGDYTTIQPALDVAADGDTILIGAGEYTEATTVRLPGWAYDIESYAHLRCDDLTIIGAGADLTIIGPPTYQGNAATGNPAGLSYSVNGGTLNISDVTIRHSYAMFVLGILYMDRCRLANNAIGLSWNPSGPGGWVRDSVFEATEPIFDAMSFAIGYGGLGSGITMDRCVFRIPGSIRTVDEIAISDCELGGINVYPDTDILILRCRPAVANAGISLGSGSGIMCTIRDSHLQGTVATLAITDSAIGGRFIVENSLLEGGEFAVLYAGQSAGSCEIHGCDLVKGSGPVIRCAVWSPAVTHDISDNYWGTTDEATIQSWIIDHNDDPQIGATVSYSPFAGQSVPTESTTWSDLKVLFR